MLDILSSAMVIVSSLPMIALVNSVLALVYT
jgi:hypothetical protein